MVDANSLHSDAEQQQQEQISIEIVSYAFDIAHTHTHIVIVHCHFRQTMKGSKFFSTWNDNKHTSRNEYMISFCYRRKGKKSFDSFVNGEGKRRRIFFTLHIWSISISLVRCVFRSHTISITLTLFLFSSNNLTLISQFRSYMKTCTRKWTLSHIHGTRCNRCASCHALPYHANRIEHF